MIRKYKKTLIITSLLTLLPIVAGLLLWDRLPERFATHWGLDGQADGWSSIGVAVFCMPLIMLAVQWLCVWVTAKDPGNKDRNQKIQALILWIIPLLSNLSSGLIYALALGVEFSITNFMTAFIGLMFVVIGNYMPKCRMNSTIGIKVSWAYTSEENWNATHRFGGRVWFFGGMVMMLCGLLPAEMAITVMLIAILVLAFVPMLYSWRYYRRQVANGDVLQPIPKLADGSVKAAIAIVVVVIIVVGIILFSGTVRVTYGETAFTIEASFCGDLTVEYAAIDSIEYRQGNVEGTRVMGFGSLKLLLGTFENEEFGLHTRYTYYNPEACIVLTSGEKTLVISGRTQAETEEIYEALSARIQ